MARGTVLLQAQKAQLALREDLGFGVLVAIDAPQSSVRPTHLPADTRVIEILSIRNAQLSEAALVDQGKLQPVVVRMTL